MTFEFLMCLFRAHFFGGFSKDTHDCCISHVVICCSWVFSVCFFNWLLMIFELLMCFLLLMMFFFSCSWFFGLYTHAFLPLIGHSWLLSCSWIFFWLLMSAFLHMSSCSCMSTPIRATPHECFFCTWGAAYAWVPLFMSSRSWVFLHMSSCLCMSTPLSSFSWVPFFHMSSCSCMGAPIWATAHDVLFAHE